MIFEDHSISWLFASDDSYKLDKSKGKKRLIFPSFSAWSVKMQHIKKWKATFNINLKKINVVLPAEQTSHHIESGVFKESQSETCKNFINSWQKDANESQHVAKTN